MGSSTTYPVIVIVGETASGKTMASIKLAQKINGEIIAADSRTVYKEMDIGTAKPTKEEQKKIVHHLLDVIYPNETFSVAQFQDMTNKLIVDISRRNKVPIVVGGTGLYIDSLLYNFHFKNKANPVLRKTLEQMNVDELTTIIKKKNIPLNNIDLKNKRRLIRIIERGGVESADKELRENTLVLGIKLNRDELRNKIEKRVDKMFSSGFLSEVEFLANKYGWENESMSGIGYRLARQYFEEKATLEEVKKAFVQRDISLARRQRTWFKRNADIVWFNNYEELIDKAVEFNSKFN